MTPISLVKSNNHYFISGDLTFATINKSTLDSLSFNQNNIIVDFDSVTLADSAGLALLVEWHKKAKSKSVTLHFRNIPQQIAALAELVEVTEYIKNSHQTNLVTPTEL